VLINRFARICCIHELWCAGIPLVAVLILVSVYFTKYAFRAACYNIPKARRGDHLPQMVSTGLIMYRMLYLYLTRTSFDVVSAIAEFYLCFLS
jgi:uncharacterized membrane protein YozB (DUF420 family)